jgi:uncharacterized protein YegP (UPF0339 family)
MEMSETNKAKRVLFQRADCKWAWRLIAANGQIVAVDGSQGYENESDARDIADRVIGGDFKDADRRIQKNKDCK